MNLLINILTATNKQRKINIMKNQTVLIGLDGATFSILDPLINEGVMPFMKEFMASGTRAELLSTVPPLTPPAWTSLVTGRSPGHHGIFDFFQRESENHHISFTTSNNLLCETVWSNVSRSGMRVTSLNFPLMMPPPEVNGNVVSGGWMTSRQLRFGCYPDGLYDRLKSLPGFNPRELAMDMSHEEKAVEGCKHEEYEDWINTHIRREQQWFKILLHLMNEDPCELTGILFDGVDKLQHLCWRFLDPNCLSGQLSSWEGKIRDLCLEYFRQLDRFLAEIAGVAGPEATIVMASDHGFGAQKEIFFVNSWLEQNGYLTWADDEPPKEGESATLGMGQLARHVYMLDWDKTLAYASTPSSNGIHIVKAESNNNKGVSEKDYESFRSKLMESLYKLVSPSTGEQMVTRIWTREEAFDGPNMHLAPDLTLALRDGGMFSILSSDSTIRLCPEPSGTHRPEGIIIARGPGIRQGITVDQTSILDVAPLLFYSLELPVPADMEGSVPEYILEQSMLAKRPVLTGNASRSMSPVTSQSTAELGYDDETEALIAKRLRALGYIE